MSLIGDSDLIIAYIVPVSKSRWGIRSKEVLILSRGKFADLETIQEFAATVRPKIEDADFETRQRIITMFNVEAKLTIEEGE
jgi:hypothetical protein